LLGTITLLPRHSLLYLPVSFLFRRFDRFFVTLNLTEFPTAGRAHIYEKRFHQRHRSGEGAGLDREEMAIGSREFLLLAENGPDMNFLLELASRAEDPEQLKELSVRPERGTAEFLVVPSAGENRLLTFLAGELT
jgi:hypothetical protein